MNAASVPWLKRLLSWERAAWDEVRRLRRVVTKVVPPLQLVWKTRLFTAAVTGARLVPAAAQILHLIRAICARFVPAATAQILQSPTVARGSRRMRCGNKGSRAAANGMDGAEHGGEGRGEKGEGGVGPMVANHSLGQF